MVAFRGLEAYRAARLIKHGSGSGTVRASHVATRHGLWVRFRHRGSKGREAWRRTAQETGGIGQAGGSHLAFAIQAEERSTKMFCLRQPEVGVIGIENCDKDGSIVSSRLASAAGHACVAHTRNLHLSVVRQSCADLVIDTTNTLGAWYNSAMRDPHWLLKQVDGAGDAAAASGAAGAEAGNPVLSPDTVVFSSVHRTGLYACSTHCVYH